MSLGLIGKKLGMMRLFVDDGASLPVTVVEVSPNRVVQRKTVASDGYSAVQVTRGARKPSRLSKPVRGHFAKANVDAGDGLWEFRVDEAQLADLQVGAELSVDHFEPGNKVDVTGTSKGKGFAGTVKRHNFRTQDTTHGNSVSHRAPGSIGQNQTPGRVFKGKKMSGHMGNVRTTVQNLKVVRVDVEHRLLLIRGAVPGPSGSTVVVRPAVKS